MSSLPIKHNLQRLLKQKDWSIAQLERNANIKEHSLQNVFRGISKNPSIELIYGVAKALGVTIEELISDKEPYLVKDYDSYSEICKLVLLEIKKNSSSPTPQYKIFNMIDEAFLYTVNMKNNKIDEGFIKWLVMKNFNN